ncbi:MAG: PHP domain-containing protein [Lachnospiraceae bacterium]|nr:PHP domain-containing protein [Lachnospiraceae bacterium]
MIEVGRNDLFHIHSFRCRHAENIPDRSYIEKAIDLGAKTIWFTDHAPFPGDPFKREHRMIYNELPEYTETLSALKKEYSDTIDIHIGLETEFFPKYDQMGYYKELRSNPEIEMLLLGQHMSELPEGGYSYDWDKEKLVELEYKVLGEAILEGIESGYFDAVAHPDRIFRRRKIWDSNTEEMAKRIVYAAQKYGLPLEKNESSKKEENYYREEFWQIADGKVKTIRGLDVHFLKDLILL